MTAAEFNKRIEIATKPLPGSIPSEIIYRLAVKQKFDKKNILDFYTQALPKISREIWIEKIKMGNITLNDKIASLDTKVKAGEITRHSFKNHTEPDINNEIKLIHFDEDFLVLNKPAPLPVHPCGRFNKNSLISILNFAFPEEKFKLIHRLDANTTGLIIIGKSIEATKKINSQFENNTIQKEYIALVDGIINEDSLLSEKPIGKKLTSSGGRSLDESGQHAKTIFKVIRRLNEQNQTIISALPIHGRTNQIRLHLADLGYPIVGDYGYKDPFYFENNPLTYKSDCLFLHAWKLTFLHPTTQNKVSLTAELPAKFINL